MKRRRNLAIVAFGVVVALLSNVMPNTASAATTATASQEAFRASVGAYLTNLRGALDAVAQNPASRAAITPQLADYNAALNAATQQLAAMSPDELDAMQNLAGASTLWKQQPQALMQQVSGIQKLAPTTPPGFLSLCTGGLGDLRGLFYGYWIAAQIASAASAVAAGFPSALTFLPGLIIVAIIYGVANGIAIALSKNLTLSGDCSTALSNTTIATTYPSDPAHPGVIVQASSQISVDSLTVLVGGIKATLDDIQARTIVITGKLADLIRDLGTAQGTANSILVTVTDLQVRSDALLDEVGPPTVVNTTTGNGLANTLNNRLDTILANTNAFQKLSVRAEIERTLADRSSPPVALFALPAVQGGYLEVVRDVVALTIQNELNAGMSVGTAQTNLAQGNAQLAAGQFQSAYLSYGASYLQAVN